MENDNLKFRNFDAGNAVMATVLIAVIVFLSAALGYSLYKNSQLDSNQQEQVVVQNKANVNQGNETANWKTYRNDEYGFEMKYPPNQRIHEDCRNLGSYSSCLFYIGYVKDEPYLGAISIGVSNNINSETASQYFKRLKDNSIETFITYCRDCSKTGRCQECSKPDSEADFYKCLEERPNVTQIGGKEGLFCANVPIGHDPVSPIYVFNKELIYTFLGPEDNGVTHQNYNETLSVFRSMLSTFKFTDKESQTAGWKTYRNNEYGFEMKIPDNWIKQNNNYINPEYKKTSFLVDDLAFQYQEDPLSTIDILIYSKDPKYPSSADMTGYYYLGVSPLNGNSYYFFNSTVKNNAIFGEMISTFKFTK